MNDQPQEPPDIISIIATVVPPIYVAFRLATGGWATRTLFLLIVVAVAGFYGGVILRHEPSMESDPEAGGDSPTVAGNEPQPTNTSPLVMAAVASAYVLFLILCFAGCFAAR